MFFFQSFVHAIWRLSSVCALHWSDVEELTIFAGSQCNGQMLFYRALADWADDKFADKSLSFKAAWKNEPSLCVLACCDFRMRSTNKKKQISSKHPRFRQQELLCDPKESSSSRLSEMRRLVKARANEFRTVFALLRRSEIKSQ